MACVLAAVLVLAFVTGYWLFEQDVSPATVSSPASVDSTAAEVHPGALHGRVTTDDGTTWEGRLRWGGGEEAFWGDYFNGFRDESPWAVHAPHDRQGKERRGFQVFGVSLGSKERQVDLRRPFMARFGDIVRIESRGGDVRVTLKSGTVSDLDAFSAGDFDDGVRVWDRDRGVVDLGSRQIRSIELFPSDVSAAAPFRLHGTVRTHQGDFTGFVQWNREKGVGSDELDGREADGEQRLRFDTIRSIARRSADSSLVSLLDGRELVLSGTREAGDGNRGMYVDDRRYGRVLISWGAFERVDFSHSGDDGPAYDDFPPGHPLTGSVSTRAGRRLEGRVVFDLDESETTETLDAPSRGVDYTIPFGLVASLAPGGCGARGVQRATVTLHAGEELELECRGDLGEGNAGVLVFVKGRERPEYVSWAEVERLDFDRPAAMYPPLGNL